MIEVTENNFKKCSFLDFEAICATTCSTCAYTLLHIFFFSFLDHCEFVTFFALIVADVTSNMMKSSKNLIHDWDQPDQPLQIAMYTQWVILNQEVQKILLIFY